MGNPSPAPPASPAAGTSTPPLPGTPAPDATIVLTGSTSAITDDADGQYPPSVLSWRNGQATAFSANVAYIAYVS